MKIVISLIFLSAIFSSCQHAPRPQLKSSFKPYTQQAVDDAVAHHRPVVIDFYADWCPICHELDRVLWPQPEIQARLAQVTALRVDATNDDDPQVQKVLQQYNIEGLPTIVFLNDHGLEIDNARLIGFVTPRDFFQSYVLIKIFKK